jgi:hypothetical protein
MPYYPPASSGGGGSVTFAEEGSAVGTGTILNFVGAGVTATFSGGTAIATIPGGTAAGSLIFLDEGNVAGTATHLNVVGSSGTVAYSGGTATLTLSGGGGDLVFIDEEVLGSPAATIDFTSIPNTYRDLVVIIAGASARTSIEVDEIGMRVGTGGTVDTGNNYGYHRWLTGAGTTGGGANSGASRMELGWMPADSAAAGMMGMCTVEIARYADTSYMKTMVAQSSAFGNAEQYISIGGGVWRNAADAIDCLRVYLPTSGSNLKTGTKVTIYGRG